EEQVALGVTQENGKFRSAVTPQDVATGAMPPSSLSSVQIDAQGNPIVTDSTLRGLEQNSPAVRGLITNDETTARQRLKKNQTMIITGHHCACINCMQSMAALAERTGGTVIYQRRKGGNRSMGRLSKTHRLIFTQEGKL
ncbi:MAG TPA: hypothetical protein VK970_16900, partial [Candidatus Methylacidiphilales bacterium]|nr:hypothetical protein [Candidatus Methylacidiphilales bacterium]